ncbi:MAG: hypothetical protein QNK37_32890 [Acidobacteriota bacterium]|nr:hypothetical protein [Acidobacteriota bacterium]
MKKKLNLNKLNVKSFVIGEQSIGGVPYITYKCLNDTRYLNCTQIPGVCPWYSELYTACQCESLEIECP